MVASFPSVEVWGSKSRDFANTCRGAGPVPVKKGAPGAERAGGRNPSGKLEMMQEGAMQD